ncbi:MAG: hypothetical protein PHN84_01840 [Desulfuromonadaceae bacterium]|nr:hypothetical protein [Desulfuromonadaceae bacterium]MDD2856792.1 hypothetical protein [Desulfuromonadaceae bacterium]
MKMGTEIDIDSEVSVKDIVNFYVKINDSSKAKKEIARLSAKDKAIALETIAVSPANREFRIDVARYFIYDLDVVVRRKAERFMEDLVPDWVTDPAESILKLLKSADGKGANSRNSAVKFLFGIVDAASLRDTFTTLLNSRNREHTIEILAIVEDYIDSSCDEFEQVKIFDACLDLVVSDEVDNNIKHHASNLLSTFFNKVQSTNLGETLRRKYIEKQVDKAEAVYRYLCSGSSGLNGTFLDDLLRPLKDGGTQYHVKILGYFMSVLEKAKKPEEADSVLDTYPDYWNQEEPPKEEKIRNFCVRILRAVDELWDVSVDPQVRGLIVQIRFREYSNKRELLEQIRLKLEGGELNQVATEKLTLMLRCFLHPDIEDVLKLQAAQLLLFKIADTSSRLAALAYLASYLENKNLNYAERGSIATVVESLMAEKHIGGPAREKARYILFIADPKRLTNEDDQKALLSYLRGIVEGEGLTDNNSERLVLEALGRFIDMSVPNENLKKAAQYLEFKIKNPRSTATWDKIAAA